MDEQKAQTTSLRLIKDINNLLDHHCSLCQFLQNTKCRHCQHDEFLQPPTSPTACTSNSSFHSSDSSDSDRSNVTVTAKITTTAQKKMPPLRRTSSPVDISLRELRDRQLRRATILAKRSDERLRQVYQSQLLAYLDGASATLPSVDE